MVLLPLTISLLARFLISAVGPSNVTLFLCDISDMLLRALPMDGSVEPFVESFQALAYVNYLEIALSTHDALLPVDPMLDLLPPTQARVSSNSKHSGALDLGYTKILLLTQFGLTRSQH